MTDQDKNPPQDGEGLSQTSGAGEAGQKESNAGPQAQYHPGQKDPYEEMQAEPPADPMVRQSVRPNVGTPPGKMLIILAIFVSFVFFILYLIFGPKDKQEELKPQQVEKVEKAQRITPPAPPPPEPPKPVLPPPPPAPVVRLPEKTPSVVTAKLRDMPKRQETMDDRFRSKIVLKQDGRNAIERAFGTDDRTDGLAGNDPNRGFANVLFEAELPTSRDTRNLSSPYYSLYEGKVIDAVLETAINTDLPGSLRAVVSRDVYAERGRNVVIPKGSRLIGSYNTGILRGQDRVYIIWTRVIMPDGTDIEIDSEAIDQLGRSGVKGDVDNRYFEVFSASILSSAITIGLAIVAEQVIDKNTKGGSRVEEVTLENGRSRRSGSPSANAALDGTRAVGRVVERFIDETIQLRPTIRVDQGTHIKVFVNRDLFFSNYLANRTQFIR